MHEKPEHAVHRRHASRQSSVVEIGSAVARANTPATERRDAALCQPAGRRAIGDGHDSIDSLGRNRQSDHLTVDVHAIADDFGRHFGPGEDRAGQAWIAVVQRRHAVEEMGRVAGACVDGIFRDLERRT